MNVYVDSEMHSRDIARRLSTVVGRTHVHPGAAPDGLKGKQKCPHSTFYIALTSQCNGVVCVHVHCVCVRTYV